MELVIEPEKIDWFLENMVEDEDSEVAQQLREAKEKEKSIYISKGGETIMAPIVATMAFSRVKDLMEKLEEQGELNEFLEDVYERSDNEERTKEILEMVRAWPEEPLPEDERDQLLKEMEEMVSEGKWFNFDKEEIK